MPPESDTSPFDEGTGEIKTSFTARLPAPVVEAMDARAKGVGLSRTVWLERAVTWVLANLPTGLGNPARDEVASKAPREVAGDKRLLPGAPSKKPAQKEPAF